MKTHCDSCGSALNTAGTCPSCSLLHDSLTRALYKSTEKVPCPGCETLRVELEILTGNLGDEAARGDIQQARAEKAEAENGRLRDQFAALKNDYDQVKNDSDYFLKELDLCQQIVEPTEAELTETRAHLEASRTLCDKQRDRALAAEEKLERVRELYDSIKVRSDGCADHVCTVLHSILRIETEGVSDD